jgi:glutathione synthase/RimK-type ligase-like ATP-grasp enzyme
MKLAIHHSKGSFSDRWIEYSEANNIIYKLVDCYSTDIIQQLSDCDALMWHFSQNSPKDMLFAKQLLYSVETSGRKVFPNFNTAWHFDDKVGQKYLLEVIGAPLAPSWIFYDKQEALEWAKETDFPKVLKLRGGAGSQNVRLVKTRKNAKKLIRKAFGLGFPAYDPMGSLKERFRRYRLRKTNLQDLLKGVVRFVFPPPYARVRGHEKRYIYFQEYIAGNDHDIRVIVIGNKAFAIKRMVRENDFRASGSGMVRYEKENFNYDTIRLSFQMAEQLKSQCAAFDFIYEGDKIFVVEVSYGFIKEVYDPCSGYWDKSLNWFEGKFNPYGWMVEDLISSISNG